MSSVGDDEYDSHAPPRRHPDLHLTLVVGAGGVAVVEIAVDDALREVSPAAADDAAAEAVAAEKAAAEAAAKAAEEQAA
eukprot:3018101-Prymnesium_polylepis.1